MGKQNDSLYTLKPQDVPSVGPRFVTGWLRAAFRGNANHSINSESSGADEGGSGSMTHDMRT